MDYQVDLDVYRGPLDLLLYLVKRNEVDICDIPISLITEQYLQYLEWLRVIDVERAGEFLVLASTLMEIKSRMLLPRQDGDDEAGEDPRLEIVRQLIEYKRIKDAAALLEQRARDRSAYYTRQPVEPVRAEIDPSQQPIQHVELWDLVSAFGRLVRETLALQPSQIVIDDTPVHVYIERIIDRLHTEKRVRFTDLFEPPYSRSRLVGMFLAVLELIRNGRVAADQETAFGEIWISLKQTQSDEATDSAAAVQGMAGASEGPQGKPAEKAPDG